MYSTQVQQAAQSAGVSPAWANAVLMQESSGGSGAPNNPMQVNGATNSAQSIQQGTQMLAKYSQETGGNLGWTLAMYNMGPGILDWAKANGISDPTTAMQKFSHYMTQHGYPGGYGDPNYIQHVESHMG